MKTGYVELEGIGRIPFQDARQSLEFTVRKSDIILGQCSDPQQCVLAKAGRRAFGSLFENIVVGKTVIHIIQNGRSTRFGITGELRKAVDHFDKTRGQGPNGQGVWLLEPGTYHLHPPAPSAAKGGRPNRRDKHGGKGGTAQGMKRIMAAPTRIIGARKAKAA